MGVESEEDIGYRNRVRKEVEGGRRCKVEQTKDREVDQTKEVLIGTLGSSQSGHVTTTSLSSPIPPSSNQYDIDREGRTPRDSLQPI